MTQALYLLISTASDTQRFARSPHSQLALHYSQNRSLPRALKDSERRGGLTDFLELFFKTFLTQCDLSNRFIESLHQRVSVHFHVKKGEVSLECCYLAFRRHDIGEKDNVPELSHCWFRKSGFETNTLSQLSLSQNVRRDRMEETLCSCPIKQQQQKCVPFLSLNLINTCSSSSWCSVAGKEVKRELLELAIIISPSIF
jgi:hypothetical protein